MTRRTTKRADVVPIKKLEPRPKTAPKRLQADPAKQRAWRQKSASRWHAARTRDLDAAARYADVKRRRTAHARYTCEAEGLHHPDCPGRMTRDTAWAFAHHHVLERQNGGPDTFENIRLVYGLSDQDYCHGMIHQNRVRADELGLLVNKPNRQGNTK